MHLLGRLAVLAGFVAAAALGGKVIGAAWYADAPPWRECGGMTPGSDAFDECVADVADLVESFDYHEFKDLAKTFLVLLSATLVATIAFAGRIVDLVRAPPRAIGLLVVAWILLVLGLAGCVMGLAHMSSAALTATGDRSGDFRVLEMRATTDLFFAIAAYVMALVALTGAGAASIARRRRRATASRVAP